MCHHWADLVLKEFFAQGDFEKELGLKVSPLCDRDTVDRAESQIGFIEYVVHPSFVLLYKLLPKSFSVDVYIQKNLMHWKEQNPGMS